MNSTHSKWTNDGTMLSGNKVGQGSLSIFFCLDPERGGPAREEEMREVSRNFTQGGIPFRIMVMTDPGSIRAGDDAFFPKDDSEGGGNALFLADSDRIYRKLVQRKLPTAGYRHACNSMEFHSMEFHSTEFHSAESNLNGSHSWGSLEEAAWILEEPQLIDYDSYLKIWQRLTGRPWTIAETERLWIREMTVDDLDGLYLLYRDPEAKRFLEPLSGDRGEEQRILEAYIRKVYAFYGYGMWAVCEKATGELIGRAGFEPYQGKNKAVELGYLIRADKRCQGFAREAVKAILDFADENLDFPAVAIRADEQNAASIRLALLLGFRDEPAPERVDGVQSKGIRYFVRRSGNKE